MRVKYYVELALVSGIAYFVRRALIATFFKQLSDAL
jgi:hypothetical protein